MINKFKKVNGEKIDDYINYVNEYTNNHNDIKIIIGTDSEQYKKNTTYVTVISFLKPNKGVHVIYMKKRIDKIKDIYNRLWNEIEYSRLIADELSKSVKVEYKPIIIHIDINSNRNKKSNIVYDNAIGYLKGLGYIVEAKPNSWAASKAADMLC